MNKVFSRLNLTTTTLDEVQKKIGLGNPQYSDIVRSEIAKNLAVIADELTAIRSRMPRTDDQAK